MTVASESKHFLRLIALGVISGYMGSTILDSVALMISARLVEQRVKLDQDRAKLSELERRFELSSQSSRLVQLADTFTHWKKYDDALELYDQALTIDPTNVHALIRKFLLFTTKADESTDTAEKVELYNDAIKLMDAAINVDKQCARAYYNRACYRLLAYGPERKDEVLKDLKTAIGLDEMLARMARAVVDFDSLRSEREFLDLTGQP